MEEINFIAAKLFNNQRIYFPFSIRTGSFLMFSWDSEEAFAIGRTIGALLIWYFANFMDLIGKLIWNFNHKYIN